ncbi:phosphate signaling complex protein PhoU [Methylotuvimicrobium alcaliphilum]|uniref:Phosphate-specific transport system accessory protein PhoU n=1 Tax=Methylotuvimicrobium alcaliphilum (strain DSM 19304 / NCIMB 14124 / VKM B-2133 / 20Z) TaxID=1091494 RepID=G4SWB6_META2|nr:phosphate signaling complex protein PhoU [Methylotuvimicrobium alcaliphilum]CCE23031.1 Phosphate transport system protein PhoU [Methylotuvimicrobium alcaliphilum 20Z]
MDINKIGHHISSHYNVELEDIRNSVLKMGGIVERQIELAALSFTSNDMEMAEQVIQQDDYVNRLEKQIDQACTEILAKRQPAAFDLRLLLSVIRTINDLERIGDEATKIAEMAIHLSDTEGKTRNEEYYEIQHLAELVMKMLRSALDSFARLNVESAVSVTAQDAMVDREYGSIIRQMVARMMEDPRNVRRTLDVLWTARALERIGDHACNICEHVIYMVKGEDVRHMSHEELERKIQG